MTSTNPIGQEVSVESKTNEQVEAWEAETPELRPSVEQEIQGKVDTNHPDATPEGLTLAAEERMEARELEIARTRERYDSRQDSDREARSRRVARQGSIERREAFKRRAASVDPLADPDAVDPREQVSREELGAINQAAARLAGKLDGCSRAAISRRLAECVVDGIDIMDATLGVFEACQTAPGQVVPIGRLEDVTRTEVSIEGRVTQLWESDSPAIAQVGLIEDESGRTKFTSWAKSDPKIVEEGERVRIHRAAKNWYNGRVSVAVTGWSTLHFPDRGRWWE